VVVGKHLEPFTDYFSVANFNEVKELRKHGIKKPILCLGYIDREEYAAFPEYQPEVTIYNKRQAEILSKTMEEASYVRSISRLTRA
jgi:alanine racemase